MTPISRTTIHIALLVALCSAAATAVITTPAPAFAQHVNARMETMLAEAADDYDMLMLDEAEAKLEEAVRVGRQQNGSARVLSRVYILLGVVRFASARDESLAEDAFFHALELEPRATLDRVYQTPVLNGVFERAQKRAQASVSKQPEPSGDSPASVVASDQLEHKPVKRATAGEPLHFEVYVAETMPVFRVYVYHRRFDEDAFAQSEMMPSSSTRFALSLDAKDVRSSQINYYIEAVDRAGKVLANFGRSKDPQTITVIGSGSSKAVSPPSTTVPAEPIVPVQPDDGSLDSGDGVGFYAMLGAGSDIGFLPGGGTSPTANPQREVSAGLAPAFAQALLDLGIMITPSAHLGLYFRWQFSPAQDFSLLPAESIEKGSGFWDTKEECLGLGLPGDCLLGLKYKWVFSTGVPEFYSSVGAGVGRVRNWLRLKELVTNPACNGKEVIANGDYCYLRDTVRTGWAHFGVGGGFNLPITDNFGFTTDAYLMLFLPDTSINLDLNLGLRFNI